MEHEPGFPRADELIEQRRGEHSKVSESGSDAAKPQHLYAIMQFQFD